MDPVSALVVLGAVANGVQVAQGVVQAARWAIDLLRRDKQAEALVLALPEHSSAEAIIRALQQSGVGGDATVTTAGGGRMVLHDANVAAGDGRQKGGDLVISADGGDLTIVAGNYKAGDGTG